MDSLKKRSRAIRHRGATVESSRVQEIDNGRHSEIGRVDIEVSYKVRAARISFRIIVWGDRRIWIDVRRPSNVISYRQATFWDFAGERGTSRVHFLGKREWHYSHEHVPVFDVVDEHPLLLDYLAPWSELYVSRPTSDSSTIVRSLGSATAAVIGDWRPASHYLNDGYAHAVLQDGHGLLLRARWLPGQIG